MDKYNTIKYWDFDDICGPINSLSDSHQKKYLLSYLKGAGACSLFVEDCYFDRDYLDEFSNFYSRAAVGYKNFCQRVHVFGPEKVQKDHLLDALSDEKNLEYLQKNYIGFVVLRPIKASPFGRTVLSLYEDRQPETPRITEPARNYYAHLAGLKLVVKGLAWQQQDTGVAACATIGLWTMFHSSAFDDNHSIPTTAEITKSAEKFGARAFPSTGLTLEQMLEAIHRQNFNSVTVSGNVWENGVLLGFSRERFSVNCLSFIRSGYPVLLLGDNGYGGHAICLVGARENRVSFECGRQVYSEDENSEFFYIHDDNFGPNIKYRIISENGSVKLKADPPSYLASRYPDIDVFFTPKLLVVATNKDIRITADDLYLKGEQSAALVFKMLKDIMTENSESEVPVIFNARFMLLREYMSKALCQALEGDILGITKLAVHEGSTPMSLHVGVIRIGLPDGSVLIDIVHDTTDSSRNMPVFVSVVYDAILYEYLFSIDPDKREMLGLSNKLIPAF